MTSKRKNIALLLLQGYYLKKWRNGNRVLCYRLYRPNDDPAGTISEKTIRGLGKYIDPKIKILKTGKHGKITLNLSSVRRLHGKTFIKRQYKKMRSLNEKSAYNV